MFKYIISMSSLLALVACASKTEIKPIEATPTAPAASAAPSVDEQLQAMGKMCADTAEARKARDAKQSFFKRLGGEKKIKKFTNEFVALHYKNEKVAPYFSKSNMKLAAAKGSAWVIANSGGPKVYKGPSLSASHGHRHISKEAFLAAGGDVMESMKANGYKEDQIQDMLCLLGSHIQEVIVK